MEPLSSTELTKQAIALQKAGDTPGAVQLLVQALNTTPNFEAAWLWLAACLSVPSEQRYCLEQALSINPESQRARASLTRFEQFSSARPMVLGPEMITVSPEIASPVTVAELGATEQDPFYAETIEAAAVVRDSCGHDLEASTEIVPAIDEARTCPHCGAGVGNMRPCTSCGRKIVANTSVAALAMPTEPVQKKTIRMRIFLQLMLVLLGCSAFWIGTRIGHAQFDTAIDTGPDKISAFVMCEQFVTDRLKVASTAKFPLSNGSDVTVSQLDDAHYRVNAYVDSQNSLGAILRIRYDCTVRYTGNENWRLENLTAMEPTTQMIP